MLACAYDKNLSCLYRQVSAEKCNTTGFFLSLRQGECVMHEPNSWSPSCQVIGRASGWRGILPVDHRAACEGTLTGIVRVISTHADVPPPTRQDGATRNKVAGAAAVAAAAEVHQASRHLLVSVSDCRALQAPPSLSFAILARLK